MYKIKVQKRWSDTLYRTWEVETDQDEDVRGRTFWYISECGLVGKRKTKWLRRIPLDLEKAIDQELRERNAP